jgi:hypothetical protein
MDREEDSGLRRNGPWRVFLTHLILRSENIRGITPTASRLHASLPELSHGI